MRFHITTTIRDTVVLDDDKRMREMLGPHFQRVLQSEKVIDSGLLCGRRGGYFIVDVDAPEELLACWAQKFTPTLRRTCSR